MDIMSGAPVFEKILGSKFFTARAAADQEQYSEDGCVDGTPTVGAVRWYKVALFCCDKVG